MRWAAVVNRHQLVAAAVLVVLALAGGGGAVYWQITARLAARQRADLDLAQRQIAAARAAAIEANAKQLSPDHFADAVALDRVQQDLAEAEQWREAIASARAAAQAYADAARQAGTAARAAADDARARMQGDKRRGARDAPDYERGLGQERQGDEHYAAGRFPEAAQAFLAASGLFGRSGQAAPAPAPAPPAPARDAPGATAAEPDAEIRDVLGAYARAFETKDLELLQRIRLSMAPDDVARHRRVFDQTRSYRIGLQVQQIVIRGDQAEVRGHREDTVVTQSGETIRTPGEFRFALRRVGDRWRIDKVR